jgi:hypothetical protein
MAFVTLHDRFREAYYNMAQQAGYRPAAPRDGLTEKQLRDPKRLAREAREFPHFAVCACCSFAQITFCAIQTLGLLG